MTPQLASTNEDTRPPLSRGTAATAAKATGMNGSQTDSGPPTSTSPAGDSGRPPREKWAAMATRRPPTSQPKVSGLPGYHAWESCR